MIILIVFTFSMTEAPQATIAPSMISTSKNDDMFILQVNRLPPPFNVNGSLPFQVWVDGERLPLHDQKAKDIIKILDLNFTQPTDISLHNGNGWLFPRNINSKVIIRDIQ